MKCGFEFGECDRTYVGRTDGGHRTCQFHLDRYKREKMFELVEKAINFGINKQSSMLSLYQFIDEFLAESKDIYKPEVNMKYRKKPLIVEAFKWSREEDPCPWNCVDSKIDHSEKYHKVKYFIWTPEGDMEIKPGDYIIKGVKGEFYPCKEDVFLLSYDKVEDEE